ncbi:T9SS type A sorting domain-containing protein [Polluticoccus soli]|uniref:T9SS type A sorting domain-containing protein n=1 Tax=Polluticoccus soli TaxID=3034150 RepID=UPI0023E2DE2B|nr:T9SS type A sorting domain-containing protein [Flavipsychrobacter sp. JY13-12]
MKRKFFAAAACTMLAATMQAQPLNNALLTSGSATGWINGHINMVPGPYNNNYVVGAAWSQITVDFTKSFKIDFKAMIQPRGLNLGEDVNDGFVVVFGSNINNTMGGTTGGVTGNDMGYYSPVPGTSPDLESNSIGVEFDFDADYDNSTPPQLVMNDINQAHVMIARNADFNNVLQQPIFGVFPPARAILPNGSALYDAKKHDYRIEWSCDIQHLTIYQDGQYVVNATFNPTLEFTNPAAVKWGFTAARDNITNAPGDPILGAGTQITIWNWVVQQSNQCLSCITQSADLDFSATVDCDNPTNKCIVKITPSWQLAPGYIWQNTRIDLGDGTPWFLLTPLNIASPTTFSHTYVNPGTYTITMRANAAYPIEGTDPECDEIITVTFYRPDCAFMVANDEWHSGWSDAQQKMTDGNEIYNEENQFSDMVDLKNEILLYPNPTNGKLKIETRQPSRAIVIADVTGRTVFGETYKEANSRTVDMSTFPDGLYLVTVTGSDGKQYKDKIQLSK